MPFGSYESEKPQTVPTFLQYTKTASKNIEGKTKFAVETVWLPGKFNNVTLQTHAFRFICSENHPLYTEILRYFEIVVPDNSYPRLEIVIDSLEQRTITVSESTRKNGSWKKLGENGRKFEEA